MQLVADDRTAERGAELVAMQAEGALGLVGGDVVGAHAVGGPLREPHRDARRVAQRPEEDRHRPGELLAVPSPRLEEEQEVVHAVAGGGLLIVGEVPQEPLDRERLPVARIEPPKHTFAVTGECDPIRDWGERYATRLRDATSMTSSLSSSSALT